MRFPTMWYARPAKPQISLRIRAVWSEPLLVAWIFYDCSATGWASFGVSKLKRRLHRLVWVYTCQNATLLEITCHGSYYRCILMNSSIWLDTTILGWFIVHIEGSNVISSKLRCTSPEYCFDTIKQCRPRWNVDICGISFGSTLFLIPIYRVIQNIWYHFGVL